MKKYCMTLLRASVFMLMACVPCAVWAQPVNDMRDFATVIEGEAGTVFGNNMYATVEGNEQYLMTDTVVKDPLICTVWWMWTAPKDGQMTFTTEDSKFDTNLSVFLKLDDVTKDILVARDDNGGGNACSKTPFVSVLAGDMYLIRVSGYTTPEPGYGNVGDITLKWKYGTNTNNPVDPPIVQPDGTSVRCDIFPPEVLSAGAAWRLGAENGSMTNYWQASGTYNTNFGSYYYIYSDGTISIYSGVITGSGIYTITFQDVPGWVKPPDQRVTITNGNNTMVRGTYTKITNMGLQTILSPDVAVAAGAQWTVDNPANAEVKWHNSYDVVPDAGNYTVNFKPLPGMATPPAVETVVNAGQFVYASGHYIQDPATGIVQMNLLPTTAVEAGVQWRLDDGDWKGSGAAVTGLNAGTHTVSFKGTTSWNAPAPLTLEIQGGDVVKKNVAFAATLAPENDLFDKAINMSFIKGQSWALDSSCATLERSEPRNGAGSLWWTFTAPMSGKLYLDTNGSLVDTVLSVYTGNRVDYLTPVASDDDSGSGYCSFLALDAVAGTTYRIAVTGYNMANMGSVVLNAYYGEGAQDMILTDGDFIPSAPNGTNFYAAGDKLNVLWSLFSEQSIPGMFWCELFASKSGGFDFVRAGGTMTESFLMSNLPSGFTNVNVQQTLNTLPDGTYTVVPMVNREWLNPPAVEADYTNNWMPITGKRLSLRNMNPAQCDLVLVNAQFTPEHFTAPDMVTVSGRVTNPGPNAMPGPGVWVEAFYGSLSAEGVFMPEGPIAPGQLIPSLAVGENFDFSIYGRVPGDVANKVLAVIVDGTDLVPELNETNNSAIWFEEPSLLPLAPQNEVNLAIVGMDVDSSQTAPAQVVPGDKLRYSVTIENKGAFAVNDQMFLELFASRDGGVSFVRGCPLTDSQLIYAPAPGETKKYEFEAPIHNIGSGVYTVVAMVNRIGVGTHVGDSQPFDNKFVYSAGRVSLGLPPFTGANIVWSQGPYFVRIGSDVTVTGTVKNTGTGESGAFWTEAFAGNFDPKNGAFIRGGQIAGGALCKGLLPGETMDVQITGAVAPDSAVGVLADSTDMVPETDETDNYDYGEMM